MCRWEASETGLSGFDFIFDTAGEALGWEHAQTPGLVKTGGVFISIVNHTVGYNPVAHAPAFSHAAFLCLSNNPATQDTLAAHLSSGQLRVPVEDVFPFTSEGVQAIVAKVQSGKSLGKNVIKIAA
jgi:NADPH:quinone reductase-like Zn-dependent oxidoreductase